VKAALATKWEPLEEGRKWKITLREDVKWSDGVRLTPQHVVDGWRYLLAKETAAGSAYYLFGVKNAQSFNQGKVEWSDVGIKVTGVNELTVELEKPLSYFPQLLAHHSTFPIRLDVIKKFGERWTDPKNIVSLGAFNLKVWQHDRLLVLERNENYYGDAPKIKNVAAYLIQEQSTAINLFDSGKLDWVGGLPSIELKKQRSRPEYRESPVLSMYYYGMNVTKPPMDQLLVRRAIAHAIDRRELVTILGGGQQTLSSWIPSGMFGHIEERGLQFDPEEARKLLKQAGFSRPIDVPTIKIAFNTNEDHQRIAENIQAQLKRNLGINIELGNEEWKIFLSHLRTDSPQLFRMGWQADYPDPDNFFALMLSYSASNFTKWQNPHYDDLIKKGASTLNPSERLKLYAQAQKLMLEDEAVVIPLMSSVSHNLVSKRVENYPLNPLSIFDFKEVIIR